MILTVFRKVLNFKIYYIMKVDTIPIEKIKGIMPLQNEAKSLNWVYTVLARRMIILYRAGWCVGR